MWSHRPSDKLWDHYQSSNYFYYFFLKYYFDLKENHFLVKKCVDKKTWQKRGKTWKNMEKRGKLWQTINQNSAKTCSDVKISYGKWKYQCYLPFHGEIGTECYHIKDIINGSKTEKKVARNCRPMLQNELNEGVGWSDEKHISDLGPACTISTRCDFLAPSH